MTPSSHAVLAAELAEQRKVVEQCVDVLVTLEFSDRLNAMWWCPICAEPESAGHAPTCALALALHAARNLVGSPLSEREPK